MSHAAHLRGFGEETTEVLMYSESKNETKEAPFRKIEMDSSTESEVIGVYPGKSKTRKLSRNCCRVVADVETNCIPYL